MTVLNLIGMAVAYAYGSRNFLILCTVFSAVFAAIWVIRHRQEPNAG